MNVQQINIIVLGMLLAQTRQEITRANATRGTLETVIHRARVSTKQATAYLQMWVVPRCFFLYRYGWRFFRNLLTPRTAYRVPCWLIRETCCDLHPN